MELETWLQSQIQDLQEKNLFREISVCSEMPPLHFCSNDYLGLSENLRLKEVAAEAIETLGVGSGASRLVSGTFQAHCDLENALASWYEKEAALAFNSGYQANVGIIPAISKNGVIFSDELNHASIIDGCRLSTAEVVIYKHRDLNHLDELMQRHSRQFPRWIITESLFSMEGEKAPLQGLVSLKKKHHAFLFLDEAHAVGVYGESGRGLAEELGVLPEVNLILGTLSKSFGAMGGFAVGSKNMMTFLANLARSFIFSTAFPPFMAVVSQDAIQLIKQMKDERIHLRKKGREVRSFLKELGLMTKGEDAPIIPVILGTPEQAITYSKALLHERIWIGAIRPPTVPAGTSRLRLSLSLRHTDYDYQTLYEGFTKVFQGTLVP